MELAFVLWSLEIVAVIITHVDRRDNALPASRAGSALRLRGVPKKRRKK